MKMTFNHLIGGIALLLAIVLALVPQREQAIPISDLAQTIDQSRVLIDPVTLSTWLVEGRNDFIVIDIRPSAEYEKGHIPQSVNLQLPDLLSDSKLQQITHKEKMLFISGRSEVDAAQAALILNSRGYQAYVIQNGFAGWYAQVLNPQAPTQFRNQAESETWQKKETIAAYYSGDTKLETPAAQIKPVIPEYKPVTRRTTVSEGC